MGAPMRRNSNFDVDSMLSIALIVSFAFQTCTLQIFELNYCHQLRQFSAWHRCRWYTIYKYAMCPVANSISAMSFVFFCSLSLSLFMWFDQRSQCQCHICKSAQNKCISIECVWCRQQMSWSWLLESNFHRRACEHYSLIFYWFYSMIKTTTFKQRSFISTLMKLLVLMACEIEIGWQCCTNAYNQQRILLRLFSVHFSWSAWFFFLLYLTWSVLFELNLFVLSLCIQLAFKVYLDYLNNSQSQST